MKLFATVAELTKAQESLGAMELRATTAEAAVADFTKQVDELTAQVGVLTSERDALKAAQLAADSKIVDLTTKLTAKEGEVSTALEGVAKQVATQAAAVVAGMGHAQLPVSAKESNQGAEEIKAQYLALTDPVQRANFWSQHKKTLIPVFHNQRN